MTDTTKPTLSDEIRADLKAKALAASPGEWRVSRGHYGFMNCFRNDDLEIGKAITVEDAAFIAAANPSVILSLLAENEALTARAEKAEQRNTLLESLCQRLSDGEWSGDFLAQLLTDTRAALSPSKEADNG